MYEMEIIALENASISELLFLAEVSEEEIED